MCNSSADIHSCEFVVRICHVPLQKGLDGKNTRVEFMSKFAFGNKVDLNPHALSWYNNHLRERLTFLAQELEKITADLPVWG